MKQKPRPSGRVPASSFLQLKIRGFPKERYLRLRKIYFVVSAGTCPQPSPPAPLPEGEGSGESHFLSFQFPFVMFPSRLSPNIYSVSPACLREKQDMLSLRHEDHRGCRCFPSIQ
jgi:hypothetical protein